MERNGIKIGFLGYCDIISVNKNCTEMRMLFNSGPAIYRDDIATKDVNKLKKVVLLFLSSSFTPEEDEPIYNQLARADVA